MALGHANFLFGGGSRLQDWSHGRVVSRLTHGLLPPFESVMEQSSHNVRVAEVDQRNLSHFREEHNCVGVERTDLSLFDVKNVRLWDHQPQLLREEPSV